MSLTALGALVLTGCVVREDYGYRRRAVVVEPAPVVVAPAPAPQAEVVVTEAPPPPQVEVVTVSPGPEFLWIGGVWAWHGRWVWEPGHWARPPRHGAHWYAPHYVYRNGAHIWVQGGWR